ILVDPDHRVAARDRQRLGLELHALDDHGVGRRFRGSGAGDGADAAADGDESERAGKRDARLQGPRHVAGYLSFDWIILACSRCATKAGRTLTISAFSSSFLALGMSTLSTASSTCWW